ncbi:MAG TPA: alpha/beta fold hydrolase [Oligoflexia bacterium]|nr:alpha/beta fold hydrolase [Oligoflexia bacterium]HMR23727.1 alpha/beta fold hydrolase [Oligoflexia bacterium]
MKKLILFNSVGLISLIFLSACTNIALQPSRQVYQNVENFQAQKPEQQYIKSFDGTSLSLVHFQSLVKPKKGVVVQFHGNAENLSSHFLSQLWVTQHGYDFVTFDYRGYGKSEGLAGFPDVNQDAAAVIQYAMDNYSEYDHQIILWGESIGGMILMNALNILAEQGQPNFKYKMILEGTFYSLKATSSKVLTRHWLTFPFSWLGFLLVTDRYAAKKQIRKFTYKPESVLFVQSKQDFVVGFKQGKKLFNKYQHSNKCKLWYEEKSHINVAGVAKRKYRSMMLNYLNEGCSKLDNAY